MYECLYILGNISKATLAMPFTDLQPAGRAWHIINRYDDIEECRPTNAVKPSKKKAGVRGLLALT